MTTVDTDAQGSIATSVALAAGTTLIAATVGMAALIVVGAQPDWLLDTVRFLAIWMAFILAALAVIRLPIPARVRLVGSLALASGGVVVATIVGGLVPLLLLIAIASAAIVDAWRRDRDADDQRVANPSGAC